MSYSGLVLLLVGLATNLLVNNVTGRLHTEPIVGGYFAALGQFKYQVSIQTDKVHLCGGSIISETLVITAAHCFIDNETETFIDKIYSVVAGTIDVTAPTKTEVRRDVERIYVPKEFKPKKPNPDLPYRTTGDIAVLKLSQGLGLETKLELGKVDLPKQSNSYPFFVNQKALISGFGANWAKLEADPETNGFKEKIAWQDQKKKMRYTKAIVIPNKKCSMYYKDPLYDEHLCAQIMQRSPNKPEGACSGDSGGPLVLPGNLLIGVLSSGPPGCEEKDTGSIYTRVTSFLPFIQKASNDEKDADIRVAEYKLEKKYLGTFGTKKVLKEI